MNAITSSRLLIAKPGRSLTHAAVARAIAAARGGDAMRVLQDVHRDDTAAELILHRAAVSGMATPDAVALVSRSVRDFWTSLPASAAAALMARAVVVELSAEQEQSFPIRSSAPSPLAWAGEGNAMPARSYSVSNVVLAPKKMGAITVLSRELARSSNAQSVISLLLREDSALSIDAAVFSDDAGSSVAHPGLLNGVLPIAASASGDTVEAAREDVASVLSAAAGPASADVLVVASPSRVQKLTTYLPDMRDKFVASAAVADDALVGVDASSLVFGLGADVEVSAAEETTIVANDVAAHVSSVGTPNVITAPSLSNFQTATIAVRIITPISFAARRAGSVAVLTGITW